MKKVVFVGYMGSGKSLISNLVAQKYGFLYLDLDSEIEKKEQTNLSTLFQKKGELYFRKLEHQIFVDYMTSDSHFVMSTGGGTPCYFDNHTYLKQEDCCSIYLKASIETLYNRLHINKSNRPLLAQLEDTDLKEFIAKHLFERSFFYQQAQHTVTVDDKSPDEILEEIMSLLF